MSPWPRRTCRPQRVVPRRRVQEPAVAAELRLADRGGVAAELDRRARGVPQLGELKLEVPPSATLGEFKLERAAAERYV
jgi:hypothetical protein